MTPEKESFLSERAATPCPEHFASLRFLIPDFSVLSSVCTVLIIINNCELCSDCKAAVD